MKFLTNITNIEDLKKAYRLWCKKLHPDNGGSVEDMQILNNEYQQLFDRLKNVHKTNNDNDNTFEKSTDYPNIIQAVINLDNIDIEICGCFVYLWGNTYPHRNYLKEVGFKWANKKKCWYWHSPEWTKKGRKSYDMDEIRQLHGSETIKTKTSIKIERNKKHED